MSFGSGTLIAKKTNYGFVITNWHVVRDSNGYVKVWFPDKREFEAAVVAVDDRWDLALLVIAEPQGVEPVVISPTIPQKGENYWAAGYRGDGTYQIRGGRLIAFQQPEEYNIEAEFIEITVPSENGCSGGPVFNAKYELAGVLFGSEGVTTMASHCGRVIKFLEQAAPQVARLPASSEAVIKAASLSQQNILQRGAIAAGGSATQGSNDATASLPVASSAVSSSSSSFGGSGVRARRNIQTTESQSFIRRERHGFLNLQYDLTAANALLAAESRTGASSLSNTSASGGFSLANPNTASSQADFPGNNHASSYPTGSQPTASASDNSIRTVQPITRTGAMEQSTASVAPTNTYTANTNTAATSTVAHSPSPTPYSGHTGSGGSGYSGMPPQSTSTNGTAARSGQMASSSDGDIFRSRSGNGTVDSTSAAETLPGSTTRTAATTPAYGNSANSGSTNDRTNRQVSGGSSATGTYDSPFQRKTETTQGGTRGGTGNVSSGVTGGATGGGRANPSPTNYNTYSQNSATTPSSSQNTVSQNSTRNNSMPWSDDLNSQYALDKADMQMDDYVEKYADDFAADPAGTDVTGAGSKFDALKIVIAILVIFFILFHTIKTMAVAEERQP
ncbi:MAG: serine protease [Planctomycetaceae bacterium]|nr:serine protease [Planctomycetaceae bacterium]